MSKDPALEAWALVALGIRAVSSPLSTSPMVRSLPLLVARGVDWSFENWVRQPMVQSWTGQQRFWRYEISHVNSLLKTANCPASSLSLNGYRSLASLRPHCHQSIRLRTRPSGASEESVLQSCGLSRSPYENCILDDERIHCCRCVG